MVRLNWFGGTFAPHRRIRSQVEHNVGNLAWDRVRARVIARVWDYVAYRAQSTMSTTAPRDVT